MLLMHPAYLLHVSIKVLPNWGLLCQNLLAKNGQPQEEQAYLI